MNGIVMLFMLFMYLSAGVVIFCFGWGVGDALRKMSRERAWKRRVREDIEELTRPQETTRS